MVGLELRDGVSDKLATFFPLPDRSECPAINKAKEIGKGMNKSPAFQFYPNDWLSSPKIAMMSPAQEGAYIRLLCYCWSSGDCTLPNDDNALLSLSRLNNIEDLRVVLKCFNQCSTDGAKITNNRLILEAKKQQSWREKSSKGGKQASENKKKSKGGMKMVATKSKPSSSSSSSSSDNKKDNTNVLSKKPKLPLEELSVDHIADWLAQKRSEGRYINHDPYLVLEKFKDYCKSKGKKYADYTAAYRNAFDWDKCQPRLTNSGTKPNKDDRAKAAILRGLGLN